MTAAASLTVGVLSFVEGVGFSDRPFLGVLTYSNGRVSPIQRAHWAGLAEGLTPSDTIQAIDGFRVENARAITARIASRGVGADVELQVRRHAAVRSVRVRLTTFSVPDFTITCVLPFVIAILMLTIGLVVLFLAPPSIGAHLQLYLLATVATFFFVTFNANTTHTFERVWLFYPLFGSFSIHLFCVFPAPARSRLWRLVVPFFAHAAAATLIVLRQVFLRDAVTSDVLTIGTNIFFAAVFAIDVVLLVSAWRRSASELDRGRVRIILVALIFTMSITVAWIFVSRVHPEWITVDRVMVLAALFPFMLGYAVVKHNLFEIDRVMRVSASYLLASGLLVGVYFAVVASLTFFTQPFLEPLDPRFAAILSTLVVAALFHPVRLRVQRGLERIFFRGRVDARRALTLMTRALARTTDIESFVRLLERDLPSFIRGSRVTVSLTGDGVLSQDLFFGDAFAGSEATAGGESVRSLQPEVADDGLCRVRLESRGHSIGVVTVEPRRTGGAFSAAELELLGHLAAPMTLASENALLYAARAKSERLAALGQVASVIVHEVKNPLGSIKVSAGILKKRFAASESGYEMASLIEAEVDRMNRTIQQILTFARPSAPELKPVALDAVIERAMRLVSIEAGAGVIFVRDGEASRVVVPADEELLLQVFLNLLLNAKEASTVGGRVEVQVVARGEWVDVVFRDFGKGIQDADRARIFQPFFTTKRGGTGLGLAIVKHIVEQHAGTVRLDTTSGGGATFVVTLPVHSPA